MEDAILYALIILLEFFTAYGNLILVLIIFSLPILAIWLYFFISRSVRRLLFWMDLVYTYQGELRNAVHALRKEVQDLRALLPAVLELKKELQELRKELQELKKFLKDKADKDNINKGP